MCVVGLLLCARLLEAPLCFIVFADIKDLRYLFATIAKSIFIVIFWGGQFLISVYMCNWLLTLGFFLPWVAMVVKMMLAVGRNWKKILRMQV